MKYRLALDDYKLGEYIPISPFYGINPVKIDKHICDGEAQEIILESVLEYCPVENLVHYMGILARKLAHGGKLIVVNADATILAEQFIRGQLGIIEYNKLLFGSKDHAYAFKLATIQLCDVEEVGRQVGLKVLEKSLNNFNFIIKFERP